MPCSEWLAGVVEWEQGSGPKGPMSCRTQGWISIRPEKAYLRPLGQFSMIFNGSLAFFFNFSPIFPCYSMGITHLFSFFHQFSMLFNGNFAFCQFSMLFNGNLRIEKLRGEGGTDGRMDGHMKIRPCVLQDIGPLVPLPKKNVRKK